MRRGLEAFQKFWTIRQFMFVMPTLKARLDCSADASCKVVSAGFWRSAGTAQRQPAGEEQKPFERRGIQPNFGRGKGLRMHAKKPGNPAANRGEIILNG